MSFAPESDSALAKPEALIRVPVGLASPLWGLFAGAAMSGAAWWWMTRWARPVNLEALFGATIEAEAAAEDAVVALAEPAVETAEAMVEAAEPVVEACVELVEAVTEPALEPVAEALLDADLPEFAVGGEAAPMSPLLEALPAETPEPPAEIVVEAIEAAADAAGDPAPKARKKPAASKAD